MMMRRMPEPHTSEGIYWLGDPASRDPAIVGEAVACLSQLAGRDYVPPAFCLTAPPHEVTPDGSLGAGAAAIARMYQRLASVSGQPDPPALVRSALVGDEPPSWAPMPWTFFNVAGLEALLEAVTECVAPYVSERARAYRAARSHAAGDVMLAVLVQRFIAADVCSSVAAGGGAVTIRSRWGLCEELAGGDGWDTIALLDGGLTVAGQAVADKRRMAVPGDGGVLEVDVPAAKRTVPCLDEAQARRLAQLVMAVERRAGCPVEAEVAWRDGRMYLLWCVPGHAPGGPVPLRA
jgi:rifampicin phosphotransferase